jgi:hypothetical protein
MEKNDSPGLVVQKHVKPGGGGGSSSDERRERVIRHHITGSKSRARVAQRVNECWGR